MKNRLLVFLLAAGVAGVSFAGRARASELVLQNGWTHAPYATSNAEIFYDGGMVYFKGAITGGTSPVAFTLPNPGNFWPATNAYVPVDLCNGIPGSLLIQPNGVVSVESSTTFTAASCFTSLDSAMYTYFSFGSTPLTLLNGWTGAPFGTAAPAAALGSGIVRLAGAVAGGTSGLLFTLPPAMRPATDVYVRVALCAGKTGRLWIQPSGDVFVTAEVALSDAQCMTSLEGVSFAPSAGGFTPLTLSSGWVNAPFATSDAAVMEIGGVVHFKGAVAGGSSTLLFTLPPALRPRTDVYVPVGLCDAKAGRLHIQPNGAVSISTQSPFSAAQCFTSLDGAWFVAPTPSGFTDLSLLNGWLTDTPSTTAAVAMIDGIVRFKGRITDGAGTFLFRLPLTLRPAEDVYLSVDMCNATLARMGVFPNGQVIVEPAPWLFGNPCPISLEGASFAPSHTGFVEQTLLNGWINGLWDTSNASARLMDGIVQLRGVVSGGSTSHLFTLPPGMRPATDVHLQVSLCSSQNGRLFVQPNGDVTILSASFIDAQCMTALDGVEFAVSTAGFTPATLLNGWVGGPYLTSQAAFGMKHKNGIVYLKGAIAAGSSALAFTLPQPLRPEGDAYVPIDLCNGSMGRLRIQSNGNTSVEAQGPFSDAQCFSSLDGAAFVVPEPGESALVAGLLLLAFLAKGKTRQPS